MKGLRPFPAAVPASLAPPRRRAERASRPDALVDQGWPRATCSNGKRPVGGRADRGARVAEDDEALRPDGGHGDGRRDIGRQLERSPSGVAARDSCSAFVAAAVCGSTSVATVAGAEGESVSAAVEAGVAASDKALASTVGAGGVARVQLRSAFQTARDVSVLSVGKPDGRLPGTPTPPSRGAPETPPADAAASSVTASRMGGNGSWAGARPAVSPCRSRRPVVPHRQRRTPVQRRAGGRDQDLAVGSRGGGRRVRPDLLQGSAVMASGELASVHRGDARGTGPAT